MKTDWKFLGIDLGAESGRCIAAILKDRKFYLKEVHRFSTHTISCGNNFYWDVLAIFEEIIEGLKYACKAFGPDFDGISVDTWGVDYVLIDPEGRILGYPYHYRDDRTDGMMDEAFKTIPKETLYNMTGTRHAQYNTLFQLLAESKRKVNLLNIADKLLLMPDFFNFMLSGKIKSEYSIASTTNLTDPVSRNWSWELIEKFGLPKNIFPEMIEPGTKLGTLLPWISEKTGIDLSTPIIAAAGHDTASAVASIPSSGDNRCFLSSGTWSLMGIELPEPLINSKSFACNFTNEGGVNGTTRFLKNIIGLWPLQECRRGWSNEKFVFDYRQLMDLAIKEQFCKAWVDLNDVRFLKQSNMAEKIIAYMTETNQKYKDEPGFITEVILESLAFSYRTAIKEIELITGKKIEKIHAVGGGINNELLTQYTADATGKTILAGPVEGTITGNIGMQAITAGAISDIKALRSIIANSFEIKTYEPLNADYFSQNEVNYKKILSNK